jgi:hypothetical protein
VRGRTFARSEDWQPETRLMFRALIEVGMFSLLLSTIPHVLDAFGISGASLWRYASSVGLLSGLGLLSARIYLVRTRLQRMPAVGAFLLIPIATMSMALMLLNALTWRTPGPYMLAVMLALSSGSGIFLYLIYWLFPIIRRED